MDAIANLVGAVVWTVVSVLGPPTIMLLILRAFIPALGNPLWRGWCQLVIWLIVGPIRLVRLLVREAIGRRGR
jgi:hypothetical protein